MVYKYSHFWADGLYILYYGIFLGGGVLSPGEGFYCITPPRVCIPCIPLHTPYNKYLKLAQERTPGIPYITHSFSPPTPSGMHTPNTPCNNCLKLAQEHIPRISHKTNAFSPPTPLGYAYPAYPIQKMYCVNHLAISRVCIPHILLFSPPTPLGYAYPAYPIHDIHCRSNLALSRVCKLAAQVLNQNQTKCPISILKWYETRMWTLPK